MADGAQFNRETADLLGKTSDWVYGFLKTRPNLRRVAVSTHTAAIRGRIRVQQPFSSWRPSELSISESTAEWHALTARDPSAFFRQVHEGEHVRNSPPKATVQIRDPEYSEVLEVEIPPAFVAGIPGGHVVGEHGTVVTPEGNLLLDVSERTSALHVYVRGERGRVPAPEALAIEWKLSPRRLKGRAAVLSTFAGRGFYHWLFDVLPRIGLLRDAGIELEQIEAFIVPVYAARYQVETLAALGIPRGKIISSFRYRHLEVEQLLVPSLPREKAIIPSWVCDFIRSSFPPSKPADFDPSDRIYIVRKQTDHGLLPNEREIASQLNSLGFKSVAMEEFTLSEKAWILGRVNTIVSPGGAGLSNIVFANPGTRVIELQTRSFPQMDTWDLANRMQLDHYFVLPEGRTGDADPERATFGDSVRADAVLETLELAGCLD